MADRVNGILPVYKPVGLTSHDVVDQVRKVLGQRAVGHAGTLDPGAEGLLLLCLGKSTKLARFFSKQQKSYRAEIAMGRTSPTWDAEKVDLTTPLNSIPKLSNELLEEILDRFRGEIEQKVPVYSAVHVNGERLYKKARRDEEIQLPRRRVTIYDLKLISVTTDRVVLDVTCSSGTYIRSLAHELGVTLGCGGYLNKLVRTSIGRIALEDACDLSELSEWHAKNTLADKLVPVERALDFGSVSVRDEFVSGVKNGKLPTANDVSGVTGEFQPGDTILIHDTRGELLAVARANRSSQEFRTNSDESILTYERVLA